MAIARIITGTMRGEISIALRMVFPGKLPRISARAVSTPVKVAINIVTLATWVLNHNELTHFSLPKKAEYHTKEKSFGGNFKYSEDPKDIGITMNAGKIRNNRTVKTAALNNRKPNLMRCLFCNGTVTSDTQISAL